MPFDGVYLTSDNPPKIGVFPGLGAGECLLWMRSRLRRWVGKTTAPLALDPTDHFCLVALLLTDARALIEDSGHWTQGNYRRFRGRRCAIGALCAAARGNLADIRVFQSAHRLLLTVADARRFSSVESMNDHSTHADVVRAFDEAIALAGVKALVGGALFAPKH